MSALEALANTGVLLTCLSDGEYLASLGKVRDASKMKSYTYLSLNTRSKVRGPELIHRNTKRIKPVIQEPTRQPSSSMNSCLTRN